MTTAVRLDRCATRSRPRRVVVVGLATVVTALSGAPTAAQPILTPFDVDITFDEYVFPPVVNDAGQVVQGPGGSNSASYNLIDDASGLKLAADNGDLDDMTFTYATSPGGPASAGNRPDLRFRQLVSGRQITGRTHFSGNSGVDNPGTRQWYEVRVTFAPHLDVRQLELNLASSNTAGGAWEFSTLTFLDANGTPFATPPNVPAYLDATGFTGSPSTGNFLWADTQTVVDVGSNLTSSGSNGAGDGVLWVSAAQTGVAGPRIGGFVWRTTLEDVRGTSNGPIQFSSSLREIRLRGDVSRDAVADVEVAKSASPPAVEQGQPVGYTITVRNSGPDPAAGIELVDELPAGVGFLDAEVPDGWSCDLPAVGSNGSVSCTTPTLGVDAVAVISLRTMVALDAPLGPLANTAMVSTASADPEPDNDESTVSVEVMPAATTTTTPVVTTTVPPGPPSTPATTTPAVPPESPSTTTTTVDAVPPGPPSTATTTTTTTAIPPASPSTTSTPATAPTTEQSGAVLPRTGSDLNRSWPLGIGSLILAGAALIGLSRRPTTN